MNPYHYSHEKCQETVRFLALSIKPLQQRLADAYMLAFIMLDRSVLPDDLHTRFDDIGVILTPSREGQTIRTIAQNLTDDQARKVINDLLSFADQVAELYYLAEREQAG